jgi:copper chaperone CopZ
MDLANVLNALSGVAGVDVDSGTGRVTVEYDRAFLSSEMLRGTIEDAGYTLSASG